MTDRPAVDAAPRAGDFVRDAVLDLQRVLLVVRVVVSASAGWLARPFSARQGAISGPVRLRRALEQLGLTYVKLGQFLAMRFDVLPAEVCEELSRLFENVEPVPFDRIVAVVEQELGAPVANRFAHFDPSPIAAASIAQVHEARTDSGERVAVKVQRPGAERLFSADMRNLRRLARLVDWLGITDVFSAAEMVSEFATWTRQEFDFLLESARAERIRAKAGRFEVIPAVDWSLTTRRVLTMEFVEGVSVSRIAALQRAGGTAAVRDVLPAYDGRAAMHHLAVASLRHMFVDGVFHGDVHPGNVLIRADNTIALLDFGIVGELTPRRRALLARYYESLATGQVDVCFRHFVQLWVVTPESDLRGFAEEVKPILRAYYRNATDPDASMQSTHWGRFTNETLLAARRNRMRSSLDLMLFFRAIGALHTNFILLDADFISELRSYLVALSEDDARRRFREAMRFDAIGERLRLAVDSQVRLSYLVARTPARAAALRVRAGRRSVGRVERVLAPNLVAIAAAVTAVAVVSGGASTAVAFAAASAAGLTLVAMVVRLAGSGQGTIAARRARDGAEGA